MSDLTAGALLRLASVWDDAANAWYYEHRFDPDHTVDYAAGFEEGWCAAAHLLREYVSAEATVRDRRPDRTRAAHGCGGGHALR